MVVRQKGSHLIFMHPTRNGQIVCPNHGSREVGKGTGKENKKGCRNRIESADMKIIMIVEKTRTGYSAFAKDYPVYTTGHTLEELKRQMIEALNLFFEEKKKLIKEKNLSIQLDLPQFFEFYKVINAKALSERIGMNQSLLAQYINGHKKPSFGQTQRILKGIQQVGQELANIQLLP